MTRAIPTEARRKLPTGTRRQTAALRLHPAVVAAMRKWCALNGRDPEGRGALSDGITSLVLAGAKHCPEGVTIPSPVARDDDDGEWSPVSTVQTAYERGWNEGREALVKEIERMHRAAMSWSVTLPG